MLTKLQSLSPTLVQDLTAALRTRFGPDVTITDVVPITQRAAVSARLLLQGGHAPASVFVKHIFPEAYPAHELATEHVEFAEELLALRFLEGRPAARAFRAPLLAWSERGYLLAVDLGAQGHGAMRSFDYLATRLARSLATLHAASLGGEAAYRVLRQQAGLVADRRRYGTPAQLWRFGLGRAYLLQRAAAHGDDGALLLEELSRVEKQITAPGAFLTLIHDDLGNARQTFEVADDLFLVDFEYAKFGHALLDLGKPMLGKFELRLTDGYYCWTNPGFPLTLATEYRQHLATLTGYSFPADQWDEALEAAFIFHALTLIGRLQHLEPDRSLVGSSGDNCAGILHCLRQLLTTNKYKYIKNIIN